MCFEKDWVDPFIIFEPNFWLKKASSRGKMASFSQMFQNLTSLPTLDES
jgi:hypothetical protein